MKRILVTGGAGSSGSHLCEHLLNEHDEVICADNLLAGSRQTISHLLNHPLIEVMRHDVTFPHYAEVDHKSWRRPSLTGNPGRHRRRL
jgi:UDP-glucuronate decarboxylase